MKKSLLFLFLLALPFVAADLDDELIVVFPFDSDSTSYLDEVQGDKNNNLTEYAATDFSPSGIDGGSIVCDGINDYYAPIAANRYNSSGNAFSISVWLYNNDTGVAADQRYIFDHGDPRFILQEQDDDNNYFKVYTSGPGVWHSSNVSSEMDTWQHLVLTHDTRTLLYVNGTAVLNYTDGTVNLGTADEQTFCISHSDLLNQDWGGHIDEVYIWDRAITSSEVSDLYDSGSGCFYDSGFSCGGGTPPGSVDTHTVNVTDLYDDLPEEGINVSLANGSHTYYNTTDSSGQAIFYNLSGEFNVTYHNSSTYYLVSNSTVSLNGTGNLTVYQAEYNEIGALEMVTGASPGLPFNLTTSGGKTYTINATTTFIYLKGGSNNVTFSKSPYYSRTWEINVTPRTTTSNYYFGNITHGVYDSLLTINATNGYTEATINTFSLNLSNTTTGYEQRVSTTNGSVITGGIQGYGLFILADAPTYAFANTTINTSNATHFYEFQLYTNNSIMMYIRDVTTGAPIYQNVTITITGPSYSSQNVTNESEFYVTNLPDGNYSVKFEAENYTQSTYSVTVAYRSTQILNAYLTQSAVNTIITAKSSQTGETLDGVLTNIYTVVNSTLTLIESKETDITGRIRFYYDETASYTFYMTKDGYEQLTFILDPILFSSYDVYLDPSLTEVRDYADARVTYTPSTFRDNSTNNFTILFGSPSGVLDSYNFTITYPGGNHTDSGSNANGGSFTHSFNITGASILSTVNVTYTYCTIFDDCTTRTYINLIEGEYGNTILGAAEDGTYGLGLWERILFASILWILAAGLATLALGAEFGSIVGGFTMGFLAYVGFVSWLMVLPALLVLFVLIAARTSD